MEAHSIATAHAATSGPAAELRRLGQISLGFAVMLLLLISCLFLVRRLSGSMDEPLGTPALIMLASACGLLFGAARKVWIRLDGMPRRQSCLGGNWFGLIISITVLLGGIAFSLPGTPSIALGLFWSILVSSEVWGWWHRRPVRDHAIQATAAEHEKTLFETAAEPDSLEHRWDESEEQESECLPPGMTQRIFRTIDEAGRQLIYGTLRCEFAMGERMQVVHLAFCPPLAGKPELSVDQVDGATARIKVTQLESFGAGVEVKLQRISNSPESVQLQFYVHETADNRRM